jgi:hypothetical protein
MENREGKVYCRKCSCKASLPAPANSKKLTRRTRALQGANSRRETAANHVLFPTSCSCSFQLRFGPLRKLIKHIEHIQGPIQVLFSIDHIIYLSHLFAAYNWPSEWLRYHTRQVGNAYEQRSWETCLSVMSSNPKLSQAERARLVITYAQILTKPLFSHLAHNLQDCSQLQVVLLFLRRSSPVGTSRTSQHGRDLVFARTRSPA